MNSRRLNVGLPLQSRSAAHSLPQRDRQVLWADLNCSEIGVHGAPVPSSAYPRPMRRALVSIARRPGPAPRRSRSRSRPAVRATWSRWSASPNCRLSASSWSQQIARSRSWTTPPASKLIRQILGLKGARERKRALTARRSRVARAMRSCGRSWSLWCVSCAEEAQGWPKVTQGDFSGACSAQHHERARRAVLYGVDQLHVEIVRRGNNAVRFVITTKFVTHLVLLSQKVAAD
jgi:hypothetical protein